MNISNNLTARSVALVLCAGLLLLPASHSLASTPVGSAFTYQGQLSAGGEAVSGVCDLRFALYDAEAGGALVARPQEVVNALVTQGLFTALLDFGAGVFNGQARWLEVAVRCPSGAGEFTLLTPRQPLTAAPYAQFAAQAQQALTVPWSGVSDTPDWIAAGPYAAGDGLRLSGSTFSADPTVLQRRVAGACPAGQFIRRVNGDGSVACDMDQDTYFAPGDGLTLVGGALMVDGSIARAADIPALAGAAGYLTQAQADALYALQPGAGLRLADRALEVVTNTIQMRVTGLCGEGEYVRQIHADGSVVCGRDADTVLSAGDGLSLAGQALTVDGTVARVADLPQWISAAGYVTSTLADERYSLLAGAGLTRSGNTLNVMTTTVQARVTGTCSASQYVRQVNGDGTVVCGTDANSGGDITAVTAGAGLSGGATSGDAALALAASYRLPQSCAAGQVPVSDGAGGWTCQSLIPAGTIAFYAQATCPAGWSEVAALRGRAVVGLPAGGIVDGTVGAALTNQGTRTASLSVANLPSHTHDVDPSAVTSAWAGDHSHSVDPAAVAAMTNSAGAHTHTAIGGGGTSGGTGHFEVYDGGSPYSAGSSAIGSAGSHTHSVTVDVPATASTTVGGHSHTVDVGNTTSTAIGSGAAFDVTMPYLQLLACSKN